MGSDTGQRIVEPKQALKPTASKIYRTDESRLEEEEDAMEKTEGSQRHHRLPEKGVQTEDP